MNACQKRLLTSLAVLVVIFLSAAIAQSLFNDVPFNPLPTGFFGWAFAGFWTLFAIGRYFLATDEADKHA